MRASSTSSVIHFKNVYVQFFVLRLTLSVDYIVFSSFTKTLLPS